MAGKSDPTAACHLCGKTADEREEQNDYINYHYPELRNSQVIWRNACKDCHYKETNT